MALVITRLNTSPIPMGLVPPSDFSSGIKRAAQKMDRNFPWIRLHASFLATRLKASHRDVDDFLNFRLDPQASLCGCRVE